MARPWRAFAFCALRRIAAEGAYGAACGMPKDRDFIRGGARFLKHHPDLEKQYLKTLQLLELNPHHPSLRLHALSGSLQELHSVSINFSYRIALELLIQDEEIIPVNVGDHGVAY